LERWFHDKTRTNAAIFAEQRRHSVPAMTAVCRTASAIAVLALALMASAGESAGANERPLRQLRATIHDIFSPPRRAKRAKVKQVRSAAPAPRSDVPPANAVPAREKALAVAREVNVATREVKPASEARSRPAQAKDRTRSDREARRPAAKETAPAQAKERPRSEPQPKLPDAKAAAPAQPEPLPAKPRGRPAKSAALPPAHEPPADSKASVNKADPAIPPMPSACQLRLTPELAAIQVLPPIKNDQCAVDDVVRLDAVMAKDGRRVAMNPPATLRCTMAEAVVHWVRDELAPAAPDLGAALKAVSVDTSFECRSRNRIKGAKLSEHGHANAIDVRTITLANGTAVTLTDIMVAKAARERIKQGACSRFTTVLGPGSDGYHETHVHLDLAERRGGYRMCQWDVRDIADVQPMPRERPADAPPRTASTGRTGARN
jgi:hypothetical protein